MKYSILFLGMILFGISSFAQPESNLKKTEQYLKSGQIKEAVQFLEKLHIDSSLKELNAKKLYQLSWAYLADKNYTQALKTVKQISRDHAKSKYYYPALILAAEINFSLGDKASALKILDFFLKNQGSIPNEFLFAAYFEKYFWTGENRLFNLDQLSIGTFRLIYQKLLQQPVSKPEQSQEQDKNAQRNSIKSVNLKRIKDVIIIPPVGLLLGKTELQKGENLDEPKDIEELRQELITRKKELEVKEILLEEKKKLLNLKEEYLKKKEAGEKPQEEDK